MKASVLSLALIASIALAPPALAAPLPSSDGYAIRNDEPTEVMSPARLIPLAAGAAATIAFIVAGYKLSDIRSVSGTSTAEAFYQGMGTVSYGMAAFTIFQMTLPLMSATQKMETPTP